MAKWRSRSQSKALAKSRSRRFDLSGAGVGSPCGLAERLPFGVGSRTWSTCIAAKSKPCSTAQPFRLCLTLGALAELEAAFGDEDMLALATRFEKGRISARRLRAHHRRGIARRGARNRQRRGGAHGERGRRGGLRGDRGAAAECDVRVAKARHSGKAEDGE